MKFIELEFMIWFVDVVVVLIVAFQLIFTFNALMDDFNLRMKSVQWTCLRAHKNEVLRGERIAHHLPSTFLSV